MGGFLSKPCDDTSNALRTTVDKTLYRSYFSTRYGSPHSFHCLIKHVAQESRGQGFWLSQDTTSSFSLQCKREQGQILLRMKLNVTHAFVSMNPLINFFKQLAEPANQETFYSCFQAFYSVSYAWDWVTVSEQDLMALVDVLKQYSAAQVTPRCFMPSDRIAEVECLLLAHDKNQQLSQF